MKINEFYAENVSKIIKDRNAKILVCGAQMTDRDVFEFLGFENVLLSGMDERKLDYTPYKWVKENAESLSFTNESFDFVITHAVLHHTQSPHKVLTEMYRVAKKGVLVFEGRDSFLIRTAEKFGFTQKYEVAGTYPGNGVNGTDIPNYIYRWTEREIEKTINTFSPCYKHNFIYNYGSRYPNGPDLSSSRRFILKTIYPLYHLFVKIFPKQQNLFSFYIRKPEGNEYLFPWLEYDKKSNKISVNYEWIKTYYKKLKYRNI